MPNDFNKKRVQELVETARALAERAATEPALGLSPEAISALLEDAKKLESKALAQFELTVALRGATTDKRDAYDDLVARLGRVAKGLATRPEVTNGMLRGAGLAARPERGTRVLDLPRPGAPFVEAFADGSVKLRWSRNGARATVGFVVETSPDGRTWRYLRTTTRTTLRSSGFAPGVAAWFRVTATNSTLTSEPSGLASIYIGSSVARAA